MQIPVIVPARCKINRISCFQNTTCFCSNSLIEHTAPEDLQQIFEKEIITCKTRTPLVILIIYELIDLDLYSSFFTFTCNSNVIKFLFPPIIEDYCWDA